ncbi:unnamed protein product [Tilletia laevis]|nr:unnamed protein product [Tilletia caries]CAD6922933.1 unnamed protein product [Tilletia laevis]CAD6948852.1 unnamed protein product [Tilletia controversa]CAD7065126.1 unnamed protein product [Tilletia caries]
MISRMRSHSDAINYQSKSATASDPGPRTSISSNNVSVGNMSSSSEIRELQDVLRRVKRKNDWNIFKTLRQPKPSHARKPSLGVLRGLRWNYADEPAPPPTPHGIEVPISLTDSTSNVMDHVCTSSTSRPQLRTSRSFSTIPAQIVVHGVEVVQSRRASAADSESTTHSWIGSSLLAKRNEALPTKKVVEALGEIPPYEAEEIEHLISSPPLPLQTAFRYSTVAPGSRQDLRSTTGMGRPGIPASNFHQSFNRPSSVFTHVKGATSSGSECGRRSSISSLGFDQPQPDPRSSAAFKASAPRPNFIDLSQSGSEDVPQVNSEDDEGPMPMPYFSSSSETECSSPMSTSTSLEAPVAPGSAASFYPMVSHLRSRKHSLPYSVSIRSGAAGNGSQSWFSCSTPSTDGSESQTETLSTAGADVGHGIKKFPSPSSMEREACVPILGGGNPLLRSITDLSIGGEVERRADTVIPSVEIDKPTRSSISAPLLRELSSGVAPQRLAPLSRLARTDDVETRVVGYESSEWRRLAGFVGSCVP